MKFQLGQVVRTVKDWFETVQGPIIKIIEPNEDLKRLWQSDEIHYLIKDNQTGEFLQVIERGLE